MDPAAVIEGNRTIAAAGGVDVAGYRMHDGGRSEGGVLSAGDLSWGKIGFGAGEIGRPGSARRSWLFHWSSWMSWRP